MPTCSLSMQLNHLSFTSQHCIALNCGNLRSVCFKAKFVKDDFYSTSANILQGNAMDFQCSVHFMSSLCLVFDATLTATGTSCALTNIICL